MGRVCLGPADEASLALPSEIRQRGVAMRPMPMVGPAGMVMMTPPPGARPPMAPGATPMGKGVPTRT